MNPSNLSFPTIHPNHVDHHATPLISESHLLHRTHFHILLRDQPYLLLVVVVSFTLGALLRTILKETNPVLVLMFFNGLVLGIAAHFPLKLDFVKTIANIDPTLFFHLFTPAIIFTAALDMDFHVFQRSVWQVLILAVPGMLLNCALFAWLSFQVNKFNWSWNESMLFGIILSAIDPVLSVSSVRDIGLSKIVVNLIKGESLFTQAPTQIFFELFTDLVKQQHREVFEEIVKKVFLKFFASAVFGFLSSRLVIYWLQNVFNDGIAEVIISFSMVYIIFFIAECFRMSGVIALCILGLLLDPVSFSPGVDLFLYRFWATLMFLSHILIYLIMGIAIAQKALPYVHKRAVFYIVIIFITLNLVRALVVLALSPFLSYFGYGFNWRWGAVLVWSGMRGTFTLNMALALSQEKSLIGQEFTTTVLMYSGTASLLTLIINATTVKKLAMALDLCTITLPKRMALYNAVQRIKQTEADTLSMLKLDIFLADANWTMAEEAIKMDYPFQLDSEEVSNLTKTIRCQECNADLTFKRNPQEIDDLMEEARLRVLTAQMASYRKQYSKGMLNQNAAQTLIGAAESYIDIKGKFMNIQEVKTYSETKGILVRVRKWLSDWVYNVKGEKTKPSKNAFRNMCHQIVFLDEFECMSTLVTFLNFFPIILSFIQSANTLFLPQLVMNNHYFLTLYIIEAVLKALAMGRAYIRYHWNKFELLIIIVGVIDVMIIRLSRHSYQAFHMIALFRGIRILRILRVLKHMIPQMINSMSKQISKQLIFQYDIAKGYAQGEEDIACLIRQIAGHERIYKEINKILKTNKQEAMKTLGLLQRDSPDIVTAVKTKQAIQTVLNTASETLDLMLSGGIVDNTEGAELQKLILMKKKELVLLPFTIPSPTAEELLQNVIWLQNDEDRIEYILKKVQIHCYDLGDVICVEHGQPEGIHLIISGVIQLHGSAPRYGVDREFYYQLHPPGIPYIDYLSTGAIIGELNCLTEQEMEYTGTCETAVQTYFLSIADLFEAFAKFSEIPSLEQKIWMKLALEGAVRTFKEYLPDQDWLYKMCMLFSNIYVMDIPEYTRHDLYSGTIEDILLVHGTVQDCKTQQRYAAPHILPKNCHQVLGTAPATKLLIIQTT
ncbi:sodium/hydrogen exchanger 10-like [Hemicordylus capensis]|uniref:sodium/hydrogen exchanger 10-like n=1 Tax=Hemicordylus capensis TaxID=884348 RepID=UPI002304A2A9|nr:sodium/hydrogen exchanger 10-like [Hemicordylus capensis]